MTIPGFTAEAPLGKMTERYGLAPERATRGGSVHPQALIGHCYEGGHCNWQWIPDPTGTTGGTTVIFTKY